MLSWRRYAAEHTAWKYGLRIDWDGGRAILSSADRDAPWPEDPRTEELTRLLTVPEPKDAAPGPFSTPLDALERELLRSLGLEREPIHRARTFRVWLTHDIDQLRKTYQVLTHALRALLRREPIQGALELGWWVKKRLQGQDPYFNLEDILELERGYGVRSTFFFLQQQPIGSAWSLADFPNRHGLYDLQDPAIAASVKALAGRGVEIGVHGSYLSPRVPGLLSAEVARLSAMIDQPINLSRQHYLNYQTWDTALLHLATGLTLDSSLGYTRATGPRTHSAFPMRPPHPGEDRSLPVLEIPPTLMDVCLPADGWQELVDRTIDETAARGGILTAIWHNTSFAKGAHPSRAEAYQRLIRRAQELDAEFVLGRDLLAIG